MDFLPDVKSLDKLLSNDWKTLVYGEKSETWDERFYSVARQIWSQILTFLESQGKKFQNHWPLYAAVCFALFIILATYKSLKYVETVKSRKADQCDRQVKQRISAEGSRIISDDGNNETSSFVEKPCPTSRSDLDNAIPADNDFPDHSRHDSSVSSNTTIVAVEEERSGEFLKNLINSIQPGNDAMDHIASTKQLSEDAEENQQMSDLPDSTRQRVDSNNCKHFYHLTPWIEPPENPELSSPTETILPSSAVSTSVTKAEISTHDNQNSSTAGQEEMNKSESTNLDHVHSCSPKASSFNIVSTEAEKLAKETTRKSANSTLAIHHESSSICCADEVLSLSNAGKINSLNLNNEKPCESITPGIELHCNYHDSVFSNMGQKLPELDLSPISRDRSLEIGELHIENAINIMEPEIRTDSKHRFRSVSHDNRTVSCAGYVDTRRGCSVSPPARTRTKNTKQQHAKQLQSKIPTPSPLAHRQLSQQLGTDETVAEAANHVRSVLLRKLKEVWEHHPRDRTPSPNCSMNSSQNSSVYYTPEGVSKIPLFRRSPRCSDRNDQTRSPRVTRKSNRPSNQSGESRPDNSETTNEPSFPVGVSAVLLYSTPKTSPSGRIHRR